MNTTYKKRSPMKIDRNKAFNLKSSAKHPAVEEIQRCIGTYDLQVVIEEDMQTLSAMKQQGLISFLCTLLKDGEVISQGRGNSILSPNNRYIERAVACAFNSSLADAAIRATKVLDTFRGAKEETDQDIEEAYRIKEENNSEMATERQQNYLKQLIQENIQEEEERERFLSQLGEMSKTEASGLIETFVA